MRYKGFTENVSFQCIILIAIIRQRSCKGNKNEVRFGFLIALWLNRWRKGMKKGGAPKGSLLFSLRIIVDQAAGQDNVAFLSGQSGERKGEGYIAVFTENSGIQAFAGSCQ